MRRRGANITSTDWTGSRLLASIHAEAFERPWSIDEFAALLRLPPVEAYVVNGGGSDPDQPAGFTLLRSDGHDIEILTIATRPEFRRLGLADALLEHISRRATGVYEKIFLEVAAHNDAAIQLYAKHGFSEVGRRAKYYRMSTGCAADALVLAKTLA
jgi:ribosomal-protein-alanine N-acetyltransferase